MVELAGGIRGGILDLHWLLEVIVSSSMVGEECNPLVSQSPGKGKGFVNGTQYQPDAESSGGGKGCVLLIFFFSR